MSLLVKKVENKGERAAPLRRHLCGTAASAALHDFLSPVSLADLLKSPVPGPCFEQKVIKRAEKSKTVTAGNGEKSRKEQKRVD